MRIMLIAFRTAMTLTLTDEITGRQSGRALTCKDDYFEAALTITDVCFDHAHAAASRMLNREHKVKPNPKLEAVIKEIKQAASPVFTKPQLYQIAAKAGIGQSNFDNRILPQLLQSHILTKIGHGLYMRTF
jgi:protein-disulfide isomerase-like protein with CxxC motif